MMQMARPLSWISCSGITFIITSMIRQKSWSPNQCFLSRQTTMSGPGICTTQVRSSSVENSHILIWLPCFCLRKAKYHDLNKLYLARHLNHLFCWLRKRQTFSVHHNNVPLPSHWKAWFSACLTGRFGSEPTPIARVDLKLTFTTLM